MSPRKNVAHLDVEKPEKSKGVVPARTGIIVPADLWARVSNLRSHRIAIRQDPRLRITLNGIVIEALLEYLERHEH